MFTIIPAELGIWLKNSIKHSYSLEVLTSIGFGTSDDGIGGKLGISISVLRSLKLLVVFR